MDVWLIDTEGVQRRKPHELPALLGESGLVWIDVPYWDAETASFLTRVLRLHPRAVHDCTVGSAMPKVHVYADHVFVVLHGLEPGAGGHVHHIELDQFVGPNWVLTVHGRMDPEVVLEAAFVETTSVLRKLESGEFTPSHTHELSAAMATALIERMRGHLETLSSDVLGLEEQVTGGHLGDPEQFLEELFAVRHGLLAIQTMAASSREVYGLMAHVKVFGSDGSAQLDDLEDQFRRLAATASSQREYLHGVIEFYQTRTGTKMTIAAERLAVIAAVTLPITALSSVFGMNVIVHDETDTAELALILVVMFVMSGILLVWTHRKGWW
jgi:Mg2+ and Co2+ transporter CorA